nr:MAG TPA: hypothetical protein [Caudoviricetes sp.]
MPYLLLIALPAGNTISILLSSPLVNFLHCC